MSSADWLAKNFTCARPPGKRNVRTRVSMPAGFPDALRKTAKQFAAVYGSKLRTFEDEVEVAPGVVVTRTGLKSTESRPGW